MVTGEKRRAIGLPAISSLDRDERAKGEEVKKMDKRLLCAAKMPPKKKKENRNAPYDPQKDEVAKWLASQPEIMAYIAELVQRHGLIAFDPTTQTWRGSNYGKD